MSKEQWLEARQTWLCHILTVTCSQAVVLTYTLMFRENETQHGMF